MTRRILAITTALTFAVAAMLAFCLLVGQANSVTSSAATPAPAIAAIAPASAPNDVDVPVVITGTGFAAEISGTVVLTPPSAYLGAGPLLEVTWLNSTTLTGVIALGLPVDVYTLTVINPDGQEGHLANAFAVTWPLITPTVHAVTPTQAPNNVATPATIAGSDFVAQISGTLVLTQPSAYLNESSLSVTWVNSTELGVVIPPGVPSGVYSLTVVNPGGGRATLSEAVTATLPPSVTAILPTSAPNDVDTTAVISGAHFQAGPTPPAIYLGDILLGSPVWGGAATMTATVPWGLEAGVYTVTVVNPDGGMGHLMEAFTITHAINSWETGGPYGGRVLELIQHPVTNTILYALVWDTGVFVTYDGAESWELILLEEVRSGMAMDAQDPDILYVGSEGGIIRTANGGANWTYHSILNQSQDCYVHTPVTHPTLPGVVVVGTRSCGGGFPIVPGVGGVFWSDDYGSSWVARTTGLTNTQVSAVAIDPSAPDTVLAGTIEGDVFLSADAGDTWRWVAREAPQVDGLAFDPYVAGEAWLLAVTAFPYQVPSLFRSARPTYDPWTPITVTEQQSVRGIDFSPGTVWAAAGDVYWSADGGANWTDTNGPRQGASVVMADPVDSELVYAGGSYGTYKSLDGGANWAVKKQGLAGVIPATVVAARTNPDLVYAKTHELGLLSSIDGGHTWTDHDLFWSGGAPWPKALAIDPVTHTRLYLAQGCGQGAPCVSIGTLSGGIWQETTNPLPLQPPDLCGQGTAITPHPGVPGRLLAAATHYPCGQSVDGWTVPAALFSSDDFGQNWQLITQTQAISPVTGLTFAYGDPDLVYAGTKGTGVLRSEDGGKSWMPLAVFPGDPFISSITAHPDETDTLYVLAETVRGSHIYVSYDRGANWEHVTDQAGVDVVIAPPVPGARSYSLLTSCGSVQKAVCRSMNGGHSWYPIWGSPRPTALGTSTDGERMAVYVGSTGGMASPVRAKALATLPGGEVLMAAGVYRLVTLPLEPAVYLPLVLR